VLDLSTFSLIIEPSAGEASFLSLLPQDRRLGVDIEPRAGGIVRADFLEWAPPARDGRTLVIGNPPFGQRAALAFDFLERACAMADAVAFILPRSFNKWTFQNRVPDFFHLRDAFDCEDFYLSGGKSHSVKTVFQIWERKTVRRAKTVLPSAHPHFQMRHCHLSRVMPSELKGLRDMYEFTIPQVGMRFTPQDVRDVTRGSHWFIRPLVEGVRERFDRLDFSFLNGMNTAHMSLSKRDIVAAYVAIAGSDTASEQPDDEDKTGAQLALWVG